MTGWVITRLTQGQTRQVLSVPPTVDSAAIWLDWEAGELPTRAFRVIDRRRAEWWLKRIKTGKVEPA